jgi:peptide chain release factor 1
LELVLPRLEALEGRYEELGAQMMDPAVAQDAARYQQVHKSWCDLEPVVTAYRDYKRVLEGIRQAEELQSDPEMRELANADLDALRPQLEPLEHRLKVLLLPKDPNDDKSVILEIRPAAGGEEAALFAGELFRMYTRYAEKRGWKVEVNSAQETGIGGYSDISITIEGQGAYSQLKFESGVHRVQRVPVTESSGRIHTSTATVAVLPEAEEVEVEINKNDVTEDVYHASSAGGQNVQKVATAIRLTHKPTGIVVSCQDERSQLQNKLKAWRVLRAKLYEIQQAEAARDRADNRRGQVGSGDRSEKIRTYNFPDGRITDHRIGKTVYNIPAVLNGDIQEFIDALVAADQAERLRLQTEEQAHS